MIIPFSFRPHAFGVCFFPTLQETLPIRLSFHPSVHPSGSRRKVRNCTFTIPCVYVCDNIETQRGWKSIRENGASSDLGTHLYLFHVSILFHPQDRASCQNKTTRELEKNLNSQTNYTLNSLFETNREFIKQRGSFRLHPESYYILTVFADSCFFFLSSITLFFFHTQK